MPIHQNRLNPLHRPVNLLLGDDQGRGEADDGVVGLLAQNALLAQRVAVGAGQTGQLDADGPAPLPPPPDGAPPSGAPAGP